MLEKEFKVIPNFPQYAINDSGKIIQILDNAEVPTFKDKRGTLFVKLNRGSRKNYSKKCMVAMFVLMCFGNYEHINLTISVVEYLDGDASNVDIKNLRAKELWYTPPDVPESDNVFFTIPIFTDYEISKIGVVRHKLSKRIQNQTLDDLGYYRVSAYLSDLKRQISVHVHRLLALTFLKHPVNVSNLVVNHLDGNGRNNSISNLEWTNHSGNIIHAFKNKLRTDTKPILVMGIVTREVVKYVSLGEFIREAKLSSKIDKRLWYRLRNNSPIRPICGEYFVKYENDKRPWPSSDVKFGRQKHDGKPVIVTDIKTRKSKQYSSSSLFARIIGVGSSSILYQASKSNPSPYKGYLIRYDNDSSPLS